MKYLFIIILLFCLNCEEDNGVKQENESYPELEITGEEIWQGAEFSFGSVNTEVGKVPFLFYLPQNLEKHSLIVALHHQSSNKEAWLNELSGVVKYAIEKDIAFLACDQYGHGEWVVDGYNTDLICETNLDTFMVPTEKGISEVIKTFCYYKNLSLDSLTYVGISLGCFSIMDISSKGLKPQIMSMIVPVPLKLYDGEYSFHNNLDAFENVSILAITGTNDEYNEDGEVQWWMDQVDADIKKLVIYDGGHIPPAYVLDSCVDFLEQHINVMF